MKTLKVALMASLLIVIFASVSIVSAATMQGTATGYWSVAKPSPGTQVTVTVNFQSSSSTTLYVYAVGIHGDWMESGRFAGPDYSDNPQVVQTNGLIAPQIVLQIPASANLGSHSYYIGIDGVDENGDSFSWDSPNYNIEFAVATNPTPTNSATSGGNNNTGDSGSNSLLVYVAVITVVAVVAILLAILLVKKSGKKRAPPVESAAPEPSYIPPPQSPKPEQKTQPKPAPEPEPEPESEPEAEPEEKSNNKDFTI